MREKISGLLILGAAIFGLLTGVGAIISAFVPVVNTALPYLAGTCLGCIVLLPFFYDQNKHRGPSGSYLSQ